MNNNNNNCNKEHYSMNDLTAALGKFEGGGGTRETDDIIISDDELFKPPLPKEDCPICNLLLPALGSGSTHYPCCGKIICSGCGFAPVYDNLGNEIIEEKCPFCRTPLPYSDEEYNERLQKRVEVGDAEAIFTLGCNYRDGDDGFPQDYVKALESFVQAGVIGCNKAYCSVGYAYKNGEGVERDEKKANQYYKLAAIGGNVEARYNLGNHEKNAGNMNRALKHFMIAAAGGHNNSLKKIQKLHTNGHATKDDYAKALRAYQAYLAEIKSTQRDAAAAASADFRYYYMVQTRKAGKRAKTAIVELALFNNDILPSIASFLDCSDLVSLALTSRSFGVAMGDSDWSLVEEAARQLLCNTQTEYERDALPRYDGESWIALLHELKMLRSPLVFDQLVGDKSEIGYVHGDRTCITTTNPRFGHSEEEWSGKPQTAISNHVMRSGKHYAKFTLNGCHRFNYFYPGVVRPINWLENIQMGDFCFWDAYAGLLSEKTDRWGESNVHWCNFYNLEGHCFWGDWQNPPNFEVEWNGRDGTDIDDCEIGMLLDLDAGTLTVYKDGRRLGVMKDGLSGEYCWMTTMVAQADENPDDGNVRIERGGIPVES